jgi:hypothetical protein
MLKEIKFIGYSSSNITALQDEYGNMYGFTDDDWNGEYYSANEIIFDADGTMIFTDKRKSIKPVYSIISDDDYDEEDYEYELVGYDFC